MKRFEIVAAEYKEINAKEAATRDKNISCRLHVLMLRYEEKRMKKMRRY